MDLVSDGGDSQCSTVGGGPGTKTGTATPYEKREGGPATHVPTRKSRGSGRDFIGWEDLRKGTVI